MKKMLTQRIQSDNAFMGYTHAISSIALYLTLTWMFPSIIFEYLDTDNAFIYIVSILVLTGASIMPDFDNTKSTAISSTGIVGVGISTIMRTSSLMIQNTVKTKYDQDIHNPHRKFWHTIVSSFLLCFIVYITTSISISITESLTIGFVFALFWIFFTFQLCFAVMFGKIFKKNNKSILGSFLNIFISLLFAILVFAFSPENVSYQWIAFSIGIGYFLHQLGDICTVSGAPLLWPIKIRGKRWYNLRLPFAIKAGGEVEKVILVPTFSFIALFGVYKVLFLLM